VARLYYDAAIDAYLSPHVLIAGSVFAATLAACVRAGTPAAAAFDALLDEAVWLESRPHWAAALDVEAVLREATLLLGLGPLASAPETPEPPA